MPRIVLSPDTSQKKPFAIQGMSIDLDAVGRARVTLDLQEVVDLRWNDPANRWEWYEDGEWHSA